MYEYLFDRIEWRNMRFSWEKLTCVLIGIIAAISFGIFAWNVSDKVPATQDDYDELYDRINAVQENPEYFFKDDSEITVRHGIITYEISNLECKVKAKFNEDFELIEVSEYDNVFSVPKIICFVILGAFLAGFGLAWLALILIVGIEFIVIPIKVLIEKIIQKS